MDPNETLRLIRANVDNGERTDVDSYVELVELVHALDDWLSRGGFLPDDWSKGNR